MAAPPPAALRRDILRLTWPVVLQNILRTLMMVVDTIMLAHVGTAAQAAMSIIGPITFTMIELLMPLGVGTIATVSRATGERDPAKQEAEAATSILFAVVQGALFMGIAILVLPEVQGLFHVSGNPQINVQARHFLLIMAFAVPFILVEIATSAILRGAGDTRTPLAVAILANVLNLAGNYVFIFGKFGMPAMGVVGAGLSTAICFALQAFLQTAYLFSKRSPVRMSLGSLRRVTRESLRRLGWVVAPAMIEPLVLRTGFLLYIKSVSLLGEGALAAHRVAITIESLSFMPGYGFSIACSALVGQFLGAKRPDQAVLAIRESVKLAILFMSGLGVVFFCFPGPLARLLAPDSPDVIAAASVCLMIAAFEQPIMAAAMSLRGALRGAGDTRSSFLIGTFSTWLVRVPVGYILAFPCGLGLSGIWITMVIDWSTQLVLFSWIVRRGKWKSIEL